MCTFAIYSTCKISYQLSLLKTYQENTYSVLVLGLFCVDIAVLYPYLQNLFSQYGSCACHWLTRYIIIGQK